MFRYDEETCIFVSAKNLRLPSQSYFRHSDRTVFQSFHRPEAVTSHVSQKAKKTFFSVRFVFEKTTYMIALTSSENPGCVRTKRATDPPLPSWRPEQGWSCVYSGIPAYSQRSPAQLINGSIEHDHIIRDSSPNISIINLRTETTTDTLRTSRSQNYRASYAWNVQFYVPLEITMPKTLSKLMNNVCWGNKVIHK